MKKIIVLILCIILIISGCSSVDKETEKSGENIQGNQDTNVRKSGKVLHKQFKSKHPDENIIYSVIEDMNNDDYKDTFIITNSTNPKLWYLHPDGKAERVLETWGKYSEAKLYDVGNNKHLAIVCTNESLVSQIWVYSLDEGPKEIFTSIAHETIELTEDGFNLHIKDYNQGQQDLVTNQYTWNEKEQKYIKEILDENNDKGVAQEDKENSPEESNEDKQTNEKKNIDPSKLSLYFDHETNKVGYQDDKGEIIIKPRFNFANNFIGEFAIVSVDSMEGVIDKFGNWVIEPNYHNIKDFSEGLAAANQDDKWGFINEKGEAIIDIKYDGATSFSEGLAAVKVGSEWGYIDKTGEMIIRPQIDTYNEFKNGKVDIKIGGRNGTMDKTGKITWGKVDTYEAKQLLPVNEYDADPEFKSFYKRFLIALKEKDIDFIKEYTSEDIKFSFGSPSGKEGFLEYWELDSKPRESRFWDEMSNAITLGGVFMNEEKTRFAAPYVFTNFPNDVDAFQYGVCIKDNVSVYVEPKRGAVIIEELDYSIVKVLEGKLNIPQDDGNTYQYTKVQLPSGYRGYIKSKYIRSPIGYRVQFIKDENGKWNIDFFIAGD